MNAFAEASKTKPKQTQFIPTEGGSNPILSAEASAKADSNRAQLLITIGIIGRKNDEQ